MIRNFGNKIAFEVFHKGQCKSVPRAYWQRATDLLDVMEAVDTLDELKEKSFPPSIRLHLLKGSRKGQWAIDIHKTSGWRITFLLDSNQFVDVKIENYR